MAQPKVIIMAMNKAKRMQMSDEEDMDDEQEDRQETKRLIKIFKNEMGLHSQKIGNGDIVEFRVMGKVSSKNEDNFDIEIENASIFENEKKDKIVVPPVISPSA